MRSFISLVLLTIFNFTIALAKESPSLTPLESESSIKTESIVKNKLYQPQNYNSEQILNDVNEVIENRLNKGACSKEEVEKFKNFVHKRLELTDIDLLRKSYDVVIRNLEIATDRFKKENPSCKNGHSFAFKEFKAELGTNTNHDKYFGDLWPFSE